MIIASASWSLGFGNMKGFVSILELIAVVIAVIVAMGVFFPGFTYTNKWNQANLLMNGRDLILTIDRIGMLYNYSFSESNLQLFFLKITPSTNIISWSETEGTFKQKIIIACNCTNEIKSKIESWFGTFKVNGRPITVQTCLSSLDNINPCNDALNPKHTSDVLVIYEYRNLTNYASSLGQFLAAGNGIVEVVDFNNSNWVDSTQNSVFGIQPAGTIHQRVLDYDYFPRKPDNSSDVIYGPWKYFYNVPFPEITSTISLQPVPVEGGIDSCIVSNFGIFTLNVTPYKFWICNSTHVYFDTDNNSSADTLISARQNFTINKADYTLSYVDFPSRIGIKFNSPFTFNDFFVKQAPPTPPPWDTYYPIEVSPIDGSTKRILLNASISNGLETDIPVVILNNTNGKTAWMAEFSDKGYSDDEKHLFLSLILWASNKKTVAGLAPNLQVGYLTSYINVNNVDMFEVYRLGIGMGHAY
ncbi:MAG: hypothetical protein V1944_01440 [Candidatus Aenigmatarchaeota archaeon]